MDFIKLNIQNFLTIGNSGDIHLEARGLNLLQGVNDDDTSATSNGSGKSSIPDALCWALYGETARGESTDAIVNKLAGKDCAVLVDLRDGSTVYRITRYRKHKAFKNETHIHMLNPDGTLVLGPDNLPVTLHKGIEKETQAVIVEKLGCSYEVFKASIYAGQEDMPDIPKMRDKQLKMLIEEAAGVQRLEKAYEIARQQLHLAGRAVETNEVNIERANDGIKKTQVEIETAKIRHAEYETGRAARIAQQETAAQLAKSAAETSVTELKKFDEAAIMERSGVLRASIAGSDGARLAADTYKTTKVDPHIALAAANENEVKRLSNEARTLAERYKNAEHELGKPCSACGKPHTADELEQLRAAIKAQLEQRIAEVNVYKAKREPLCEAHEVDTAEHKRLLALVPDVSAASAELNVLDLQLRAITGLKNGARTKIGEAQAALQKVKDIAAEANPQDALTAALEQRIVSYNADITRWAAELIDQRRAAEVAGGIMETFSPAGVRAHILDTVTPFLNDRTAEYLGTMSDGNISAVWSTLSRTAKGELREKFVIDVAHLQGGSSFGLISGGEKKKVRLACMLALQDLTASRASKPINLWLGDEIDEALDAPGIERLMTVLEKKAREKGTVIVISHNEMRDWIDDVTTIRKTGGVSTVEGALREAILT